MSEWTNFFVGELGAAAALTGLLFVALSVNQQRILSLGRMADRGLEGLVMLFLVLVIASLPLIPRQPPRLLGSEIFVLALGTLGVLVPLQRGYMRVLEPEYRRPSTRMVYMNRFAMLLLALGGAMVAWRGDATGLYVTAAGVLLSFVAAGASAWVLLIEINR